MYLITRLLFEQTEITVSWSRVNVGSKDVSVTLIFLGELILMCSIPLFGSKLLGPMKLEFSVSIFCQDNLPHPMPLLAKLNCVCVKLKSRLWDKPKSFRFCF